MNLQSAGSFSDQELSLIPGKQSSKSVISPVAICSLVKLLPFLLFFLLSVFHVEDSVIAVTTIICVFIEFVFVKNVSGFNLVGLKWSIDFPSMAFHWYSKPEPFVPLLSDTNFFWMSFFIFFVIWLICFFIAFFSSTKIKATTALISFIGEGVNLYMFSKAHSCAKKQVEKAVLNSIQEEVHFDLVPENGNDNEAINDNKDQEKENEAYFLPKKKSKISDTTSVALPPPLMPVKDPQESKDKNNSDAKEDNAEKENEINNINDNKDDKGDNENNGLNEDDDVDFY